MWMSESPSVRRTDGARLRVPRTQLPPIERVLVAHDHYDQLDRRTLRRLVRNSPDVRWAAPVGVGRYLKTFGATAIGEHGWWDRETASDLDVSVVCTPARHFSGRAPWNRNRTLWCGWILRAHGLSIFFAGDTAQHPEFAEIARRFGPFDLSLIPIGAYQPQWMMQQVHMNPEDAVQAYADFAAVHRERGWTPPATVPIHCGTFKLSDEPMDEPPRRLTAALADAGHDAQPLWLLQHAQTPATRRPQLGDPAHRDGLVFRERLAERSQLVFASASPHAAERQRQRSDVRVLAKRDDVRVDGDEPRECRIGGGKRCRCPRQSRLQPISAAFAESSTRSSPFHPRHRRSV